jgi:hypothetical protein
MVKQKRQEKGILERGMNLPHVRVQLHDMFKEQQIDGQSNAEPSQSGLAVPSATLKMWWAFILQGR